MNESSIKTIVTTLLLGISLFTALALSAQTSSTSELAFLFIAIILSAGALFGMWMDEHWTFTLSMFIFGALALNMLWLYFTTHVILLFAFGLLVNACGFVICFMHAESPLNLETYHSIETYDINDVKRDLEQIKKRAKKR